MRYITFIIGNKRRKLDEYRPEISLITTLIVLGVIVASRWINTYFCTLGFTLSEGASPLFSIPLSKTLEGTFCVLPGTMRRCRSKFPVNQRPEMLQI